MNSISNTSKETSKTSSISNTSKEDSSQQTSQQEKTGFSEKELKIILRKVNGI